MGEREKGRENCEGMGTRKKEIERKVYKTFFTYSSFTSPSGGCFSKLPFTQTHSDHLQ